MTVRRPLIVLTMKFKKKLDFYGIKGTFLDLIQFFLQGRYQKVFINKNSACDDTSSEWTIITHGVPQGSILGHLLFLVYINDLPLLANDKPKNCPFCR